METYTTGMYMGMKNGIAPYPSYAPPSYLSFELRRAGRGTSLFPRELARFLIVCLEVIGVHCGEAHVLRVIGYGVTRIVRGDVGGLVNVRGRVMRESGGDGGVCGGGVAGEEASDAGC